MKTYLFLDGDIYSPDEQTGTFGKEVTITEKDGDEVRFTVNETGKRGYVVYPELFAENTPENASKIEDIKKKMAEAAALKKAAEDIFETLERASFNQPHQ